MQRNTQITHSSIINSTSGIFPNVKVVGYYLSQDQTPSVDPWDTFSFRSTYSPEARRVEESTPEPPAATANHRPGISDVTTRSKCEQQHEQERPATRRGGRRVGAS